MLRTQAAALGIALGSRQASGVLSGFIAATDAALARVLALDRHTFADSFLLDNGPEVSLCVSMLSEATS